MGSIEGHLKRIKEHVGEIQDAIDAGPESKPIDIGFHCSACVTELLELYLHKSGRITIGKLVKHDWFSRPVPGQKVLPMIERNLPVTFPSKDEIYGLIYEIEDSRNKLIYGSPPAPMVRHVLESFMKLKEKLEKMLEGEGIKIE